MWFVVPTTAPPVTAVTVVPLMKLSELLVA
jgi:hypothetical protein